jgi:hypothetical protein
MIIDQKKKFMFFKAKRTAGSLFEKRICEQVNHNIICSYKAEFESKHEHTMNYTNNKFVYNKILKKRISKFLNCESIVYCKFTNNLFFKKIQSHISQDDFISSITDDEFKKIYKKYKIVSIVRCPYESIKSQYLWKVKKNKIQMCFDEYIEKHSDLFFQFQKKIYTYNNKLNIDMLLRYENLNEDLKYFENETNYKMIEFFNKEKLKSTEGFLKFNNFNLKILRDSAKFYFENFSYKVL